MRLSLERLLFMRRPLKDFLTFTKGLGFEGVEFAEFELVRLFKEKNYSHEDLYRDIKESGLTLSGIYWSADFQKSGEEDKILEQATNLAKTYRKIECWNVVVGPPRGGRSAGLSSQEVFKQLDQLVKTLRKSAEIFVDHGVRPVLHNHYDTLVETREELEHVLTCIEPELLGFCPDTAHLLLGGMDPLEIITKYRDRVTYAHLKDLKQIPRTDGRIERWYELTTEVGAGVIDFPPIIRVLKSSTKVNWLVIEQDFTEKSPEESAKVSLDYVLPLVRNPLR